VPADNLVARWTRATFLGWSLGFLLILVCIAVSSGVGLGDTQFPIGLGMGLGVGLIQRRLIAERTGTSAGWLPATALGLTAPFVAHDISKLLGLPVPYSLAASIVAGGLVVGVLQWRILRRHSSRAARWIVASLLGWTLASSTVVLNDKVMPRIPGIVGALIFIAVILVGGIILGAITGLVLPQVLASDSGVATQR